MKVTLRRFANAFVLTPHGRLDQETCEAFRSEVMAHVDAAGRTGAAIVLDLSALEYVSSAGLRSFLLAAREVKAQQGRISAAALQPMVAEIFDISHFNLVFQVFPTVREALSAVSAEAARAYDGAAA